MKAVKRSAKRQVSNSSAPTSVNRIQVIEAALPYACLCVNQRAIGGQDACCDLCGGVMNTRTRTITTAGFESSGRKPVFRLAQIEHVPYGLRTLQAKSTSISPAVTPSLFERAA